MNLLVRHTAHDSLAYQLAAMRTASGLTALALAKLAKLSSDTITGLEHTGCGQVRSLLAVLEHLGGAIAGAPDGVALGMWLADLRRSKGNGQRMVAEGAGLSQPTLIALERSTGSIASLTKVLAFYGLPLRLVSKASPHEKAIRGRRAASGLRFELHEGDCRERLAVFAAEGRRFHGCVTDPPYEIGVTKWDRAGLAFDPAVWKLVADVLLPGAYVLAFASPRRAHRVACAMEDAGLIIRDSIAWLFSSGVPWGNRDISRAIDVSLGVERVAIGRQQSTARRRTKLDQHAPSGERFHSEALSGVRLGEPVSDEAKQWAGYGTRLKPGREDVIVAMKPFSEATSEANVLRWGVGALNIDAGRVPGPVGSRRAPRDRTAVDDVVDDYGDAGDVFWLPSALGRYPSNVILGDGFGDAHWQRHFHVAKPVGRDRHGHPTAKPVRLLRNLLKLCIPPGETVLDIYAGCASVGEAALRDGYRYVGVEIDPRYCEIALARLRSAG